MSKENRNKLGMFVKGHKVCNKWKKLFSLANKKRRSGIYKKCLGCGKDFYNMPSRNNRKYCTKECCNKYRIVKPHPAWNKGNHTKLNNALEIWHKRGGVVWNKGKPHLQVRGEKHPKWIGGRTLTSDGYWQVYSPNHPKRNRFNKVLEHRLVMEKHLGRYLEDWEVVHHKDGNRQNNNMENLEVLTEYTHAKLHHKERWTKTKAWHTDEAHCEKVKS